MTCVFLILHHIMNIDTIVIHIPDIIVLVNEYDQPLPVGTSPVGTSSVGATVGATVVATVGATGEPVLLHTSNEPARVTAQEITPARFEL
jgi:hypothetical protein